MDGGIPAFIAAKETMAAVNTVRAKPRTDFGRDDICTPPAESIPYTFSFAGSGHR
ncbi:hypothetical protein QKG27_gp107 [Gallid alphaherpesvirus 3]|uniref:Uncharacterized protein ORF461 n=1 Tax=Gallid alphaherpesvirus 3 TaxID=35250 RepID=F8TC82_9ALPH|nr:hypothetical protein QKG27_gp107 [Gallid alphaherpesvirus 3]AEI00293.1 hypothetical protein [Gallid alphaherpesvirus 3]QEY02333.1 hypothetical protein [Gallid alphaherpesvirus 3]